MSFLKELSAIKPAKRFKHNENALEVIAYKHLFKPDTSELEFKNANRLYSLIRKK